MIPPEQFLTTSLSESPIGSQVCRILAVAIDAVNPYVAVKRYLSRSGNNLTVNNQLFALNSYSQIFVIGAGKASVPMADAVCDILGNYFTNGIIITKEGYASFPMTEDAPPN